MKPIFRHIVITGASSGIGAALAVQYARQGVVLGLLGRNEERLKEVTASCTARNALVETASIDVCDKEAVQQWLQEFDDRHPVDLLIANAGISGGTESGMESLEDCKAIFAVNMEGIWNTVFGLMERMQARKSGQIGVMASLAGHRGFPGAPAYTASKAAARVWGEAMRGCLAKDGVGLSVICPGFVQTPMTDVNPYPMPFLISPEKAARYTIRGLEKNASRISFPPPAVLAMWFLAALPAAWTDQLLQKLPKKPSR